MLIKICGIQSFKEIDILNEEKPDYAGFVFAKSKRKVDSFAASSLTKRLDKNIKKVGVFRFNSLQYILEVLSKVNLDVIQLHGDEDNEFIRQLREKTPCLIWKAFSIKSDKDFCNIEKSLADAVLLDGSNPGSGKTFNWDLAEDIKLKKKIFIAGGLNEENVVDAINLFNPDGVDVSSGVEVLSSDGTKTKDRDKIHRLIKKVRENDERKI